MAEAPRCNRCNGLGELAQWGEILCPRCGIWINADGDELGPPITEEQAKANYDQFVVTTAENVVQEARRLTKRHGLKPMEEIKRACRLAAENGKPLSFDGLQIEHEDGWVYEYVEGEEPRRVRRVSTSAKDTDG